MFESFSDEYESEQTARAAWLQPDEESEAGRRRRNDRRRGQRSQITSTLRDDYDRMSVLREGEGGRPARYVPEEETLTQPPRARRVPEPEETPAETVPQVDPEELSRTARETEGLRTTVAEIVDKYNKRSEEEIEAQERALREKIARQEAERIARENFLKNLPPELAEALKEENAEETAFGAYDDFSGVRPEYTAAPSDPLRAFAQAHAAAQAAEDFASLDDVPQEADPQAGDPVDEPAADEATADEPITDDPAREEPPADEDGDSASPEGESGPAEEKPPVDYSSYLDSADMPDDGDGYDDFSDD